MGSLECSRTALSPLRWTTGEVCARARISRATLWRRVADGRLPRPVDYGRQALFSIESVERALLEAVALEPSALDLAIARKVAARRTRAEGKSLISVHRSDSEEF